MENKSFLLYLAFIFVFTLAGQALTQEILYPELSDISATYQLGDSIVNAGDTIIISRTVINTGENTLSNLYLVDILPGQFELIEYSLYVNGAAIPHLYQVINNHYRYRGYFLHEWVIDRPDPDDTANVELPPSAELRLEAMFICETPGIYVLPFHSLCTHNGETGLFTIASFGTIRVLPMVSVDDAEENLAEKPLLSIAYPNPFNNEVIIKLRDFSMGLISEGIFTIYDIGGRVVYKGKTIDLNRFRWRPSSGVAGGMYFYSIHSPEKILNGKLVYLK